MYRIPPSMTITVNECLARETWLHSGSIFSLCFARMLPRWAVCVIQQHIRSPTMTGYFSSGVQMYSPQIIFKNISNRNFDRLVQHICNSSSFVHDDISYLMFSFLLYRFSLSSLRNCNIIVVTNKFNSDTAILFYIESNL